MNEKAYVCIYKINAQLWIVKFASTYLFDCLVLIWLIIVSSILFYYITCKPIPISLMKSHSQGVILKCTAHSFNQGDSLMHAQVTHLGSASQPYAILCQSFCLVSSLPCTVKCFLSYISYFFVF